MFSTKKSKTCRKRIESMSKACRKPARTCRKSGCKPGRKPGLQPGLQLARMMECGLCHLAKPPMVMHEFLPKWRISSTCAVSIPVDAVMVNAIVHRQLLAGVPRTVKPAAEALPPVNPETRTTNDTVFLTFGKR